MQRWNPLEPNPDPVSGALFLLFLLLFFFIVAALLLSGQPTMPGITP